MHEGAGEGAEAAEGIGDEEAAPEVGGEGTLGGHDGGGPRVRDLDDDVDFGGAGEVERGHRSWRQVLEEDLGGERLLGVRGRAEQQDPERGGEQHPPRAASMGRAVWIHHCCPRLWMRNSGEVWGPNKLSRSQLLVYWYSTLVGSVLW